MSSPTKPTSEERSRIVDPASTAAPILWHIWISPYSEKVRWALAHKSVEHELRTPMPGGHVFAALWLTRGGQITLPVMQLEGTRIGDSTAIIAALEERYPEPPLFPLDREERRRALQLEDWFDESLIPPLRRLFFFEMSRDPERNGELMAWMAPGPLARFKRFGAAAGSAFTAVRFGTGIRGPAEAARTQVLVGLDKLEAELGDSEYLVGDHFSIADLSVAASFHPLVLPPEGPLNRAMVAREHLRFRESLRERPGFQWVEQIYRRHRRVAAAEPARPLTVSP